MAEADWTHRADHIRKHGTEVAWANEALADPERIVLEPDPSSKSGKSVRTIGYSTSAHALLVVITIAEGGVTYGASCWPANDIDSRRYERGEA